MKRKNQDSDFWKFADKIANPKKGLEIKLGQPIILTPKEEQSEAMCYFLGLKRDYI